MKTTIDIPEVLYKKAKSVPSNVVRHLSKSFSVLWKGNWKAPPCRRGSPPSPYWANSRPRLCLQLQKHWESGELSGGTDFHPDHLRRPRRAMKGAYFDVSYLAKLHWRSQAPRRSKCWRAASQRLRVASTAGMEFAAVGHRKVREKAADLRQAQSAFAQLQRDTVGGGIIWLPLELRVYRRVESFFIHHPGSVFLRASDALHLACAAEHGFTEVYSNDRPTFSPPPHSSDCGSQRHRSSRLIPAARCSGSVGRPLAGPFDPNDVRNSPLGARAHIGRSCHRKVQKPTERLAWNQHPENFGLLE